MTPVASLRAILAASMLALAAVGAAEAQLARLAVRSAPVLLDCKGQPCFRVVVNGYDAADRPVALTGVDGLEVFEGETPHPTFFRAVTPLESTSRRTTANTPLRVTLLLVDTSGSMRQREQGGAGTKFDAARAAITQNFLEQLQDGEDRVAIAPFDSRAVRQRIMEAPFRTTRAEAVADLNRLQPSPRGNTAFYSAIDIALERVTEVMQLPEVASRGVELLVVAFTDGRNDVQAGDDPGLLTGDDGLSRTIEKVRRTATQIPLRLVTVGFEGSTFDQRPLQQLAHPAEGNYFSARNRQEVGAAFRTLERERANAVYLTFGPVRANRLALAGAPVTFQVALGELRTDTPRFEPPALGPPTFNGVLTRAELDGFERAVKVVPGWLGGRVSSLLTRVGAFGVYATLLAVLWFAVPKLLWPERYAPRPSRVASTGPRVAARPMDPSRPGAGGHVTIASRQGAGSASRPAAGGTRLHDSGPGARMSPARPAQPQREPEPPAAGPRRPARPPGPQPGPGGDATIFIPSKKPPRE